jgi:DNA-binding winged helix-turn-helix (wHTH) protein/Tfp pilus assembly protein PilF
VLDLRAAELRKDGTRVKLQGQPYQALVALLERPGEVVTREELRQRLWPDGTFVDFDLSLNAVIRRLRQALGDDAESPRFIATLPKVGYRFIAPVKVVSDDASAHTASEQVVKRDPSAGGIAGTFRPVWLAALAVIVAALLIAAFSLSPASASRAHVASPEAKRTFEMGRYEESMWTRDDLQRSAQYFESAVRQDPQFAAAWGELAHVYSLQATLGFVPLKEGTANSRAAALKAIEMDDSSAAGHMAMGAVLESEWSWLAAEKEFKRALALDPNNADAHQTYGYYLVMQGRMAEAIFEMQRALALDPLTPNKRNSLAVVYFHARRFDDALAMWNQNTAVESNAARRHTRVAFIYESKGMQKEAVTEWGAYLRSKGQNERASEIERAYIARGFAAARELFFRNELQNTSRDSFGRAEDYVALGDKDRAIAALDEAVAARSTGVLYLGVHPAFDPLRSDPRFLAILKTVGLPAAPR